MGMYMYSQDGLNIHTKAPYGSLVPRRLEKLEKHPLSNISVCTGELGNYCLLSKEPRRYLYKQWGGAQGVVI